MGSSVGNQNPWATYDTYKDCSQGICSIYCPQWCYIVFPPPPPSFDFGDDVSNTDFSPLIIAVIGILASAFILISYYTIISKYCRRRGGHGGDTNMELNENGEQSSNDQAWSGNRSGLDEAIIKRITVFKYKKGDGFIDGTDCSVCLSEFEENESLRLLPKCSHAFHVPCIDTWLKSHATCPLCRAMILPPPQPPPPPQQQETSPTPPQLSSHEYQHRVGETVIVVQDVESNTVSEETVNDSMQELQPPVRRSMSLNLSQINEAPVSISEILQISEEDQEETEQAAERGKRGKILNLVGSSLTMKRSVSAGRVMLSSRDQQDKGKNSVAITT